MIEGIISAAASITNSIIGIIGNLAIQKKQQKTAFEQQKELQSDADQYQRNLMADQYSIEKKSLQNAGYSISGATAGGLGNLASSNATPGSAPSYPSPVIGDLSQLAMIPSQVNLQEAQAAAIKEETRGKQIENDNKQTVIDLNNDLTKATTQEKKMLSALHGAQQSEIGKIIERIDHEIRNIDQDTRTKAAQEYNLTANTQIQYKDLDLRTQLSIVQVEELVQRSQLDKAQAAQCYAQVNKLAEEVNLLKSQGKINDKQLLIMANQLETGEVNLDLLKQYGDGIQAETLSLLEHKIRMLNAEILEKSEGKIKFGLPFNIFGYEGIYGQ